MLGRRDYTRDELDHARTTVERQLAAYRELAAAVDGSGGDPAVAAALATLERVLFDNMVLVLDRYFVHRLRTVAGGDGNPINEVEMVAESLMNNDGVLRGNDVVRYVPEASVLGLKPGDRIRLRADDFDRLATAFFAEIERRFL